MSIFEKNGFLDFFRRFKTCLDPIKVEIQGAESRFENSMTDLSKL